MRISVLLCNKVKLTQKAVAQRCVPICTRRRWGIGWEVAFGDEVAPELLTGSRRDRARRAVRLEPVRVRRRRGIQVLLVDTRLARRAWTFHRSFPGRAGVDERRPLAVLVDVFKVDNELGRVVFRVREDLGAVERDDMVRDDLDRFGRKIVVIDPQERVEPVDFVGD